MVGPVCGTVGTGGAMFSWSELLSSLGMGSSGCGRSLSLIQTKRMGGIGKSTGAVVTSVVASRGGTGSGFIISLFPKGSSTRVEASDMCMELRVDDRVEGE